MNTDRDYAYDEYLSGRIDEELDRALDHLRDELHRVAAQPEHRGLAPSIRVRLSAGAEDQPLLVVDVEIGSLESDFDPDDWPADAVAALKREIRVAVRQVDAPIWLDSSVTVRSRATRDVADVDAVW